jgi:multiple sugar transport system permease protein
VLLPLIVALLARSVTGRMRTFYRAAIFAPFLVAPVAAAILWRWLLAPDGGLANQALGVFGLEPVNWLREPGSAFVSISVIAGWQLLGFSVLIVSAGLSNINDVYFSAARVDGASRWRITRQITVPLLSPTLLMMVVLTVLISGQWVFPLIDTLTHGGPDGATTNLYYLIYDKAFTSFDVGLASAAGVLFFAGFAVFAVLAVWLIDRFSFYDD